MSIVGRSESTPTEVELETSPPGLLRRLPKSRIAMIGIVLILFWVSLAALAPWLGITPPNLQDYAAIARPKPSLQHWLGVDPFGRDILSRLVWGARTVLTVAPTAVIAAYLVGCSLGLLAGYFGRAVDTVISRLSDVILSFPVIVLYVILIANLGPSRLNIIIAVVLASPAGASGPDKNPGGFGNMSGSK